MNINDIKTGDIMLIRGTSFVSKGIIFFQKLFGIQSKEPKQWIPSHTATFLWQMGILFVAESVDTGFKIRRFDEYYSFEKDDIKVLSPFNGYTYEEVNRLVDKIYALAERSIMYGYFSLFAWIIKICSFNLINIFIDNEDITICYESTARIGDAAQPEYWEHINNFEDISIFEIINNKFFYLK